MAWPGGRSRGVRDRRSIGRGGHQATTCMLPVMYPIVCMGPPNPSRKPPPHGTRHCQKYVPAVRGVMKLKVIVMCGPAVHGELAHRFAVRLGEAIGTLRP